MLVFIYIMLYKVVLTLKSVAVDILQPYVAVGPFILHYYSTRCNTCQIWSWCGEYSSSVINRYPAIYVISCVGEKMPKQRSPPAFLQ